MAEQNITKAEAFSAHVITAILCLVLVFLSFFSIGSDRQFSFDPAFFCGVLMILIGTMDLIQAIAFKRLEDK